MNNTNEVLPQRRPSFSFYRRAYASEGRAYSSERTPAKNAGKRKNVRKDMGRRILLVSWVEMENRALKIGEILNSSTY